MVAPAGTRPVKVAEVIKLGDVRRKSSADSCSMKPFPDGVEALAIKLRGKSLLYRIELAEAIVGNARQATHMRAIRRSNIRTSILLTLEIKDVRVRDQCRIKKISCRVEGRLSRRIANIRAGPQHQACATHDVRTTPTKRDPDRRLHRVLRLTPRNPAFVS